MRATWFTRTAATLTISASALFTAGFLAATPAGATPAPAGDPAGANGTVKIEGPAYESDTANEPHVTCEFQVKLFDFDADEHGNLVFAVQPPTGSETVLLRRDGVLLSPDPAGGGRPDPDGVFAFSATDLALAGYTPHPRQGYHVKLTVERIGAPGAGKHKVFWLRPCQGQATGQGRPGVGTGGTPGQAGGGGSLPVTGAATGGVAVLGLGLVAGGAALLMVRRRRTRFTA